MSAVPDIIDRLLAAVTSDAPIQRGLVVSAADEIERLRSRVRFADNVIRSGDVATLTDAEREALEAAARIIDAYEEEMDGFPSGAAATLRGLLERLK